MSRSARIKSAGIVLLSLAVLGFTPARDRRSYQFKLHYSAIEHRERLATAIADGLKQRGGSEEESEIIDARRFSLGSLTVYFWGGFSEMRMEFTSREVRGCSASRLGYLDAEVADMLSSLPPDLQAGLTVKAEWKKIVFQREPNKTVEDNSGDAPRNPGGPFSS